MKKSLLSFIVILFVVFIFTASAQAATYYVAQSGGSDSNNGSVSSPFQTIQKCASVAVSGDSCLIRAGTYRETVRPTNNGVTFAPDSGASVTVSGADLVTGWSVHQGNIYKSSGMNWDLTVMYNQVFVDGQMMNLARWPNAPLDPSHPTWAKADGGEPSDFVENEYFPWVIEDSDLTQLDGFWNGGEVTDISAGKFSQAGTVTSYSRGHLEFRNLHGSQSRPMEGPYGTRYPYYLSNVLGALDTAGEWYYGGGTLYLWTPNGDNPSNHTVEAKRRQFAFDLKGKSNTTIKGINIFASSVDMDLSSSNNVLDGINVKYVWHQQRNIPVGIHQEDSKWGAWNTGIRLAGSNNVLKNCTIAFSSSNGVYLRGTHQVVNNCTIHDVAYIKVEGGAVAWMGDDPGGSNPNSKDHEVTYNTMYNSGRSLIIHYWGTNFKISHNNFYNACINVGDCGITYTTKPGSSGEISYNLYHENQGDFWRYGISFDQNPENLLIHHNVVWNVPGGMGIPIGEPATNISIFNNTVSRVAPRLGITGNQGATMNNVRVYNNLVDGSGIDGSDIQNNLETDNPGFVDPDHGNFQLKSGSPAIDAGRVISGITDGYVGSAPDIGAYEYGAQPWTAGASESSGGGGGGSTPPPRQ